MHDLLSLCLWQCCYYSLCCGVENLAKEDVICGLTENWLRNLCMYNVCTFREKLRLEDGPRL